MFGTLSIFHPAFTGQNIDRWIFMNTVIIDHVASSRQRHFDPLKPFNAIRKNDPSFALQLGDIFFKSLDS